MQGKTRGFARRIAATGIAASLLASGLFLAFGSTTAGSAPVSAIQTRHVFNCSLRSPVNNRFVSDEAAYKGASNAVLRARATTVGPWEKFRCYPVTRGWAIRSLASGKFVTVELGYRGTLAAVIRASATRVGPDQTFALPYVTQCACYGIRAANGLYVTPEVTYTGALTGVLRARARLMGSGQRMVFVNLAAPVPATTKPPTTTVKPATTTTKPTATTTTTVSEAGTIFADQFSGTTLDTTKWVAMNRPGDLSNQEQGCYKPSNVTEGTGLLTIHTLADNSCAGYNYTSGMIQPTNFNFTYGTVEFRAKFAGGAGPWPAVWLLGANCQQTNIISAANTPPCAWPQPGSDEIDIAEIVAGNKGNVNEFVFMSAGNGGCSTTTTDTSLNWHTYQLIWAPGHLTWKIDGVTTCTDNTHVPNTPMFPIINTAVGGAGGGTIQPNTLPQTTNIDYITVTP